jgi:hypothetical protein
VRGDTLHFFTFQIAVNLIIELCRDVRQKMRPANRFFDPPGDRIQKICGAHSCRKDTGVSVIRVGVSIHPIPTEKKDFKNQLPLQNY